MKLVLLLLHAAVLGGCVEANVPERGPSLPGPSEPAPIRHPSATPPPPHPAAATAETAPSLAEVFPHVRVDTKTRVVEVDATVPIDAHNEKTPIVYLELIACTPDTKEHEVLAVTKALPRHVHAALLMIGLKPGKPGEWDWTGPELVAHPPTGDPVGVSIAYEKDGKVVEAPATDWVVSQKSGKTLASTGDHFVFAGSRIVTRQGREWYEAEGSGTLIGLTTFGGETIAWSRMYHNESDIEEPQWIANAELVPAYGTRVVLKLRPGAAVEGDAGPGATRSSGAR